MLMQHSNFQVKDGWFSGNVSVTNNETGASIDLASINIRDEYNPRHSQFQKLVGLVEIVFHGLGGGAERLATVAGLTANQLWINNNLTRDYQTAYMGNSSRELPYRPANMGVAPPIWGFTRKLARHSLKLHTEPTLHNTTIDKIHCN